MKRTFRILEVCRSFPHHRAGGLEWHAQDLVEALEELGAQVTVLTSPLPKEPALARLRAGGGIATVGRTPGAYDAPFLTGLRGRTALIAERRAAHVIHAQGFAGPLLWGLEHRAVPVVTTIHGTLFSETALRAEAFRALDVDGRARALWRFKHRWLASPYWRAWLRSQPNLIVDSEFSRGEVAREAGRRVAASVVPLGVDLRRYPVVDAAEARRRVGLPLGVPMVLLAGRLEAGKRPLLALEAALGAMRSGPDGRGIVVVVGEGTERPRMEAMAHDRRQPGVDVRFEGRSTPEQLNLMFAAADAFVNADGAAPAFGLANAEALLHGTPVVAADTGATREVVAHGADGCLLPIGAPAAQWSRAMEQLLADERLNPGARTARSLRARARFDRRRMAERTLLVLERAAFA